jgi:RP/EB family microtubule-associated protein
VGGRTPVSGHRSTSTQPNEAVQALQAQLKEMSTHMEGLEKERDFYFAKVRFISLHCRDNTLIIIQLRDIEILVQQELEMPDRVESKATEVLKEIQKILYSTEVRSAYQIFHLFAAKDVI